MVNITVDRYVKRNVLMVNTVITFMVIYLFNLFWEPLFFLMVTGYVTLNHERIVKRHELFISGIAVLWLLYACIARLFGRGPGLTLIFVPAAVLFGVYLYFWRNVKNEK